MTTLEIVDWGSVQVDAWAAPMSDEAGLLWDATERRQQGPLVALKISNRETGQGGWITKPAVHQVVTADGWDAASAEAVLLTLLGGEVLLAELPDGPDTPAVRALWKAHLVHHHGIGEVGVRQTLDSMREAHAIVHRQTGTPPRVPHRHVTPADLNRK